MSFSVSDGARTVNTKHTIQNAGLASAGGAGLFHNKTAGQVFDNFRVSDSQGQTVFEDQFDRPDGDLPDWDINGDAASLGYPIYQRDRMRGGKAPMVRKKLYVLDRHIEG